MANDKENGTNLQTRTAKIKELDMFKDGITVDNGKRLYEKAYNDGLTVSALLETLDPSSDKDELDAFGRQMAAANIRTKSIPEKGIYADKVERFYASNQPVSVVLFPEFINREMRQARLAQNFLNDLIAVSTPVDSDTYRSIYVDTTTVEQFRMKRVAETAEIPTAKIKTQENAISLRKYGLALEASYEVIRRMRIDQLRVHLNLIGMQTLLDKMATIADIAINGDGNNNAATNYNATDIDSAATGNKVTWKAWIGYLMKFFPYNGTTIAANTATLLKILTMQFPNADPLMLLAQYSQAGNTGLNVELAPGIFVPIRLVIIDGLSNDVILGLDKRFGIEEVTEIGANLTETDKIIRQQLNEVVISEVVGYDVLYPQAIKTLTLVA